MRNISFQLSITVVLFFAVWISLSQIDWVNIFKVEEYSNTTEEELGKLFWNMIDETETEIENKKVIEIIDSLVDRICDSNEIDKESIKLHIVQKDEINAFALPDHHLVIYSGLLEEADNEGEVLGVISHEIAHMEKNHIMKKLIKEIGLSVLISMAGGDSGGAMLKQTLKTLSSSAFDRELEKEADMQAVDYLINARIDPEGLAEFLYKMLDKEPAIARQMSWFSTHPELMDRVEYIIEYSKGRNVENEEVLAVDTWTELGELLRNI